MSASMQEELTVIVLDAFLALEAEAPPESSQITSRAGLEGMVQGIWRVTQRRVSDLFDKYATASRALAENDSIVCEDDVLEASRLRDELYNFERVLCAQPSNQSPGDERTALGTHRREMITERVEPIVMYLMSVFGEAITGADQCDDEPPIRPTRRTMD
jgi:hypothetical protein